MLSERSTTAMPDAVGSPFVRPASRPRAEAAAPTSRANAATTSTTRTRRARSFARRIVPTSWLSTAEPLDSRRIGLLPPSEHCARLPREPARLLDPGHRPRPGEGACDPAEGTVTVDDEPIGDELERATLVAGAVDPGRILEQRERVLERRDAEAAGDGRRRSDRRGGRLGSRPQDDQHRGGGEQGGQE